jgi:signal transduction histidine kinase
MSHELRTPLNSIIGFTGIILQGMSGKINEEQKTQLTMVKNSANHLLSLINDVLDISKIEAGKVELLIQTFNFKEVMNEVIGVISPLANEKGLKITTDIPQDIKVYSDKRRMYQIFVNLVSNAVKYTEKGIILITAGLMKGDNFEIIVSDTGMGIRAEEIEKLFQPFHRIEMSYVKTVQEGTGLGLHLTEKLLKLLGGDISVNSEYGKGSEFTTTLPLRYRGENDEKYTAG